MLKRPARFFVGLGALAFTAGGLGQDIAKPGPSYVLTAAQTEQLRSREEVLVARERALAAQGSEELLPDVAIYRAAVEYALRFPEQFFRPEYFPAALKLIEEGLVRADEMEHKVPSWPTARGLVARGYRSAVDGSVQPYCVWVPKDYDSNRPARLDVILHGRNGVLNEVSFLTSVTTGKIIGTETGRKGEPDCLKLYVFGRANNSYRWAGEADVFEALASVRSRYRIDPERIVLRGFSMGGSGAWHLGLHFPSRWAAVEAGAGYVETRPEVLQTIKNPWALPSLAIHDASNCAVNMTDLPFVAYVGSIDPQREQNDIIRRNLQRAGYAPEHLAEGQFMVGEGFGHAFRPESKAESDAFIARALPRHRPKTFDFVTYTPSYGEFWDFHVDALERLYERAELRGTWDDVHTVNIRGLKIVPARQLQLDGQSVSGSEFHKNAQGRWESGSLPGLYKHAGLQGPIDDALQQPFLCVAPESGPDAAALDSFREDYWHYFHGELRVKAASAVTPEDVAGYNLVLFGDATTNPWIRKILSDLPVKWTDQEIVLAGRTFPAATTTVAMIYPNPLNPRRYVVLNSGYTFPGRDVTDMHWFLHPRMGDFAAIDKKSRAVQFAGFFDQNWQVETK